MQTAGVHHVGLSVTNVERSKDFYMDLFGWKEVGADQKLGYVFLSDGKNTITPWHQSQPGYNRTHAGLHHLALAVNGIEELMRAEQMLRKKEDSHSLRPYCSDHRGDAGSRIVLL